MSENVTKILSFGEEVSGSGALIVAEIDPDKHTDDDGNVESSFLPGTVVYFLIHHDPGVVIVNVDDTAGGGVQKIGEVKRSMTREFTFTHSADTEELSHIPNSVPSVVWYGESSTLTLDGRVLKAPSAPCLGDLTYTFTATQYKFTLPGSVSLDEGEEYPVDIVIEYRES